MITSQTPEVDTFSAVYAFFSDRGGARVFYSPSWDKFLARMILHLEHTREIRNLPEKDLDYLGKFDALGTELFPGQDWFSCPSKYNEIRTNLNGQRSVTGEYIPKEYSTE